VFRERTCSAKPARGAPINLNNENINRLEILLLPVLL
jgi:hypothetical protein